MTNASDIFSRLLADADPARYSPSDMTVSPKLYAQLAQRHEWNGQTCANCHQPRAHVQTFTDAHGVRGYCEGCWNPFGEILGDES